MVVGFLIGFLTVTTVVFGGLFVLCALELDRLKAGRSK